MNRDVMQQINRATGVAGKNSTGRNAAIAAQFSKRRYGGGGGGGGKGGG